MNLLDILACIQIKMKQCCTVPERITMNFAHMFLTIEMTFYSCFESCIPMAFPHPWLLPGLRRPGDCRKPPLLASHFP